MPSAIRIVDGRKPCSVCGDWKPLDAFSHQRDHSTGRASSRRACRSVQKQAQYIRNRECVLASQKVYREQHRTEHSAANIAWQRANPERYKETTRKFRDRHRDRLRQYHRDWSKAHPERVRANTHKRRARLRGVRFEKVDYAAVLRRDGYICHICGAAVSASDLSFDHVIPIVHGGPHVMSNIKVTHLVCNLRKGARLQ